LGGHGLMPLLEVIFSMRNFSFQEYPVCCLCCFGDIDVYDADVQFNGFFHQPELMVAEDRKAIDGYSIERCNDNW